ncbi:MAG: hypothetical protein GY716_09820 [bacterium]|nr:hypothetical protein [bacterium]
MTLVELAVVAVVASLVVMAAATYAFPRLATEGAKGAVYDLQSHVQLARLEAVNRGHACRFVIKTVTSEFEVHDTMGTGSLLDDDLLYSTALPSAVTIDSPDDTEAVTLPSVGPMFHKKFGASFDSDGTVEGDAGGQIVLAGGGDHYRLSVYAAGATQVEYWDGVGWIVR